LPLCPAGAAGLDAAPAYKLLKFFGFVPIHRIQLLGFENV